MDDSRDLVDFLDREVLPFVRAEAIYSGVKWTSTRGRYLRGPCPLHGGDNPTAFSVDTVTKGWTCWSHCGSGSALAYLNGGTQPHGREWVERAKELAAFAGVPFPERERTEEEVRRTEERDRREALLGAVLAHAQAALSGANGKAARTYLEGRGLGDALDAFGVFTTRSEVQATLTGKGFTRDEVEASGVVHDPRWEGRLVIPWRDRWGHLRTFAARDLTGKAEDADKYLFMKGTKKADLVAFGLDEALRGRPDFLVIVEGLLDVVNLQGLGFPNVAALGGAGKELSAERWEGLLRLAGCPMVLVMDNDTAGREGTLAALENVRKVRNSGDVPVTPVVDVVDPVHLGAAKDPDELVRKEGLRAFHALLGKREPAALFVGRSLLGNVSPASPEYEKRDAVVKVSDFAASLPEGSHLDVDALVRLAVERTGFFLPTIAEVVKDAAAKRKEEERRKGLAEAVRKAQEAVSDGKDPLVVSRHLQAAQDALRAKAEEAPPPFSVDRLEAESRKAVAGRSSGWAALDRLEVSFNPGELAVFGARTGHCKTSVLVGLLRNWAGAAAGDELLVLYSQEEPEVRVYHRLLALLTEAPGNGWTTAEVRDYLRDPYSRGPSYGWPSPDALEKAKRTLRSWEDRLLVVSRPAWTVEDLEAHAHELADRRRVGGVLVDYLQRVPPPPGRYDRRDIEVSAVARRLKALAVDLGVPVVAGCQVNREAVPDKYREKLAAKTYEEAKKVIRTARPDLSHLREGGAEQEADLVLGLLNYAADFRTDEGGDREREVPPVTRLEVGTLKNRYGVPGRWVSLAYEGRFNLIRDPKYREEV